MEKEKQKTGGGREGMDSKKRRKEKGEKVEAYLGQRQRWLHPYKPTKEYTSIQRRKRHGQSAPLPCLAAKGIRLAGLQLFSSTPQDIFAMPWLEACFGTPKNCLWKPSMWDHRNCINMKDGAEFSYVSSKLRPNQGKDHKPSPSNVDFSLYREIQ